MNFAKPKEAIMQMNPYLFFDGTCELAFKFYEQVLGGKIVAMFPYEGGPPSDDVPPDFGKKIMHARLIAGDVVLMGSDAPPKQHQPMKGFSVSLQVPEPTDAERIFAALSKGGTIKLPLEETFWARRFGMLVDQFGTPWMINCEKPIAA
jgi:PhnB protein